MRKILKKGKPQHFVCGFFNGLTMTINIEKRRHERERALRAVFQLDYHKDKKDLKRAVMAVASGEAGFDEEDPQAFEPSDDTEGKNSQAKEDTRYAELVCGTVIEYRESIDERISCYLRKDWPFERIPEAEKAVLRVAVAEMVYLKMPKEIAINEAVELAKQYGDDNAPNYINGILHRMSVDIKKKNKNKTKSSSKKPSHAKENDSVTELEESFHAKENDTGDTLKTDEAASAESKNNGEDTSGGWTIKNNNEADKTASQE